MLRGVILLSLCAASTLAFSLSPLAFAPAPLAFSPRFLKHASPAFARPGRPVRCGGLRMQEEPEKTQVYAEQGSAEVGEQTPVSREPSSWFEKTTAQVRPTQPTGMSRLLCWCFLGSPIFGPERCIQCSTSHALIGASLIGTGGGAWGGLLRGVGWGAGVAVRFLCPAGEPLLSTSRGTPVPRRSSAASLGLADYSEVNRLNGRYRIRQLWS